MIVIVATLDTKGDKVEYLKRLLVERGERVIVVDAGVLDVPAFKPDIPREEVAKAAGYSMEEVRTLGYEAEAMDVMARGASEIVRLLYNRGEVECLAGIGGTMNTSFFSEVSRSLPLGIPKVLISTCLFSPFFPRTCAPDTILVPLLSDIWGMSGLCKRSIESGTNVILAVTQAFRTAKGLERKKFVAVTTLGTSTLKYVMWIKPLIEREGKEVAVFHIGGGQGQQYEAFIREGLISASFDMCFLDVCPETVKDRRIINNRERLLSAVECGIPVVLAPGAVTVYSFGGSPEELPETFRSRKNKPHNPHALILERSDEEIEMTAAIIAERLKAASGPVAFLLPTKGFLEHDRPGKYFHDPEKFRVVVEAFRKYLPANVKYMELDSHINDEAFAEEAIRLYRTLL